MYSVLVIQVLLTFFVAVTVLATSCIYLEVRIKTFYLALVLSTLTAIFVKVIFYFFYI